MRTSHFLNTYLNRVQMINCVKCVAIDLSDLDISYIMTVCPSADRKEVINFKYTTTDRIMILRYDDMKKFNHEIVITYSKRSVHEVPPAPAKYQSDYFKILDTYQSDLERAKQNAHNSCSIHRDRSSYN